MDTQAVREPLRDNAHGEIVAFDFESHRLRAIDKFQRQRPTYEAYATCLESILDKALRAAGVKIASIEARAKSVESLGNKATTRSDADASRPQYEEPLVDIKDLTGVRVITFFPSVLSKVDAAIYREFEVLEKTDKSDVLREEGRFGYQSVHYLVRLGANRTALPEYATFTGLVAEIRVRTILQHAWAEIEHDIQYKSAAVIPAAIRRRFSALAGLLEIADREFEGVQQDDAELRRLARESVKSGDMALVEITPDALKAYLDKSLGPDGRMAEDSYEIQARILKNLGFQTMAQVAEATAGFDDDKVSRAMWGNRQGQLTRFEGLLLAGMGDNYVDRRDWASEWLRQYFTNCVEKLRAAGLTVGAYSPPT